MNRKDERRVAKVEGTRVAVLIFIILILTPLIALPGELQKVIKFSSSDLHFSKFNDYTIVKLKGALSTNEVGSPALPSYPVRILIPCEATATKVEVISCEREKLAGKYFIIPAQPPRPISFNRAVEFSKPNPKVYNSPTPYPGKLLELTGTGSKEGYRIANVIIYPLQYSPSLRVLEFYHSITFKITYEEENHETMALSPKQKEVVEKSIRQLVINPEDITLFAPPVKLSPIGFKVLEPNDVEYCIITSATLAPEFERLANWKTKKGIPAQIVTTDWIYSHYFGNDDQAKIRNFIIDANETWGTIWFLLGGDVGIIPARKTYLFHVEGYPLELDTIPCDLYYSDLDGSWDVNGNGVYGELDDYVDLYSDVYVGRASVSTVTECATFVNKVLTYEKNPPPGFIEKILLVAKKLYDQPEYWGDVISDSIAAIVPYEWEDVKLYQSLGNLSKKAVMDSLNQGFGFCHWAAHGHFDRISDILLNYDAAKLNNGDKLGIHNSIACFNAAFDYSYCIAEYLMNNSNGGAIAFIGNSRYGWATPPVIGPSEKLDLEFYRTLTDRGIYNIGQTYGFTKDLFVPIASSDVFMLWCIQNLILLGDPEMPIWTSEPKFLDVTHPSTISMGSYNFNVECRSVGEPVSNVFVCLMKANEVYATGVTNLNGEVTLNVVPASSGTLYVTCTVDNFYPYEGICTVIAAGPYVRYVYHEIDDSIGGNNNGYVDNGESVKLSITLENTGDVPVIDVYGVLRVNDPYVTALSDTIQGYGDIMPGDSATSNGSYSFSISASTPDAHLIHFELEITDTGNVWIDTVSVLVRAPHIVYYTYNIDDTDGIDPNGYLDVGETASLILGLWNRGMGDATGVNAKIHTNDTYITISDSIADFGDIPSSNTADNSDNPYVVTVANDAPIGHIVEFNLYVNVADGLIDTSTFYIYIGGPGLLYGDHDIGNVTFTVTCQGICGFASQDQLQGNGFIYPKGGENLLCIGSIWMGNSKDYVVNRDYGRDADWVVTWEPNGKLRLGRKEYSDQDGWAMYSDEGHPNPNHIVVTQRSWAWKGSPYDDFVIISYMLKNNGLAPINSLYVGQFMDFDMIDPYNNMMGTDTTRRLVYEWYQDSIYVGVKLLDPTIAANLSGINNPEYVWPYAHTPDSIKIKFLKGYLSFPSAYADTDWSIIVSAGPFDLEVNDSVRVAFAILGGDNLLDLKANADRAQEKYDAITGIKVSQSPKQNGVFALLQSRPNPFSQLTVISYQLPRLADGGQRSAVSLRIYDLAGKLVRTLVDEPITNDQSPYPYEQTITIYWNGKDENGQQLPSGVYFCQLKCNNFVDTKKIILVR